MSHKQLLFVACLLGILACGACFVPSHYTPPPPPPIVTERVKRVLVKVIDKSESHRLDVTALTWQIVDNFNQLSPNSGPKAYAQETSASNVDTVLEVEIFSVSASSLTAASENDLQQWEFEVQASATLKRKSGEVIWRGKIPESRPRLTSYARDVDAMWRDPMIQSDLLKRLGTRLSAQAIYQFPGTTTTTEPNPPVNP